MPNTSIMLAYLSELELHNDQVWFHENKAAYREASAEFEKLIGLLIREIGKTDASILGNDPAKLTFKLMRDTRFSHDKSPYNPSFRAHISSAGKLPIPVGYFLMVRPGGRSFLGGGLFADMFRDATAMVRDSIAQHGNEFFSVIHEKRFAQDFSVRGEALKNVPAGYDATLPQAEYLKNKSWYLEHPVADELVLDADRFVETAVEKFALMRPFNDFINRALAGFKMPER